MSQKNKDISKIPLSLKIIIQSLPELAYAVSKEGKLVVWNKNVEIGSGYSKEELYNLKISDFVRQPDKEKVLNRFREVFADVDRDEQIIEFSLQSKSGNIFPVIGLRTLIVLGGKEYFIGIAIRKNKLDTGDEELSDQVGEIIQIKNQLENYFSKTEEVKRAQILLDVKTFFSSKDFNYKLINSLPGVFYVYEKLGDKFFLRRWNNNHETDLGYSSEELLNMQPSQFFTKIEYVRVEKVIKKIFITGSAHLKANVTHKSGRQIPYLYQGYIFEDKGRLYFMGLGVDISIQQSLERKQKRQEREKKKAKEKFDAHKRELIATAVDVSRTSKTIEYTLNKIDEILGKNPQLEAEICNNLINIKNELTLKIKEQDNWEVFKLRFTEVHKDFFDKLKVQHSTLTKSELKICAYLRIHLSSSQISSILNISNEGIKKSRYRIRKKLNLLRKDSLEDYIAKF